MKKSLVLALLLAPLAALAEGPVEISHQGFLLGPNDVPVEGATKIEFGLYKREAPDGASDPIWWKSAEVDVNLAGGRYALSLGSPASGTGAIPAEALSGAGDRWLGISIAGVPLVPRLRLGAVPFATEATHAASADGLSAACAGCVTAAQLGAGSVGGGTIADGAITGADIATGTLGKGHFAAASLDKSLFPAHALDATVIDGSGLDVGTVGGLAASATAAPLKLLALNAAGKFPASVIDTAGLNASTVGGFAANAAAAPNTLLTLNGAGKFPASVIDTTGLNASTVGGFSASATPVPNALLVLDANGRFPSSAIADLRLDGALPFVSGGALLTGADATAFVVQSGALAIDDTGFGAGTEDLLVNAGETKVLDGAFEYRNVTVKTGGKITVSPWNGLEGGRLSLRATGTITVESGGFIDVDGKGYRGGIANACNTEGTRNNGCNGMAGESFAGLGFVTGNCTRNAGGGGGGAVDVGNYGQPGGGGGYGSAGTQVAPGSNASNAGKLCAGFGGDVYGDAQLTFLHLGAGGGASGTDEDTAWGTRGGHGGAGGGALSLEARTITIAGTVTASGAIGGAGLGGNNNGGGGGGSGGSLRIAAKTLTFNGTIRSRGGAGGAGVGAPGGGAGGDGRIHLSYIASGSSLTGAIDTVTTTARTSLALTTPPGDRALAVYLSAVQAIPAGKAFLRVDVFQKTAPGTHVLAEFCAATTAAATTTESCFVPVSPSGALPDLVGTFGRLRLSVVDRTSSYRLSGLRVTYR